MKIYKKIADVISKVAEVIVMIMISSLVIIIVTELFRRNFLNQSYRGTIELCGIAFLWMAFIGLIPLYHDSGLMSLEFLINRAKGTLYNVLYLINKTVSLVTGVVMVIAFIAQYPYVNTRFYSSFTLSVPYTVQYLPMAIAGAYIAFMTVYQFIDFFRGNFGKAKGELREES